MEYNRLNEEVIKLVEIMKRLRGKDGCPWDKEQNYYSLKPYIIEEAYEVVEALEKKDMEELKEELGDLLLQVVFQAQIGRENNDFDLSEVFAGISNKLIRRHPHVFQGKEINDVKGVLATWEDIKRKEGKEKAGSILDRLSRRQPALNQAYEIQDLAAEVGFDWDDVNDVIDKIEEELNEVKEAMEAKNRDKIRDEIGDLLFAVVNLTRFNDINPELALLGTILKFKRRFNYMERKISEGGYDFEDLSLQEMDSFWEEAKREE